MTSKKAGGRRARGLTPRLKLILGTLIGFMGLYYLSFHPHGIVRHFETRDGLRKEHERLERLQLENAKIEKTIERLQSDKEYIEKVAREQYHLSKEGEQIYVIRKDLTDSLETSPEQESPNP